VLRGGRVGVVALMLFVCAGCALRHTTPGSRRPDSAATRNGAGAGTDAGAAATLEARDPVLSAALFEVSVAPNSARHLQIADRYRELGILDAAFDHYQRARDLTPQDARASEGLARVWRDWGFPDRALGDAARAVYYAPTWAASHNTMGTILTALGRGADARRAFDRAVGLDTRAAYAFNNLCYLSFLEGATAQAFVECRAALAIDPVMASARNNLALIYAASQRDDLAEREFLAAGDAAAAAYNIGLVHLAEKRYDDAWQAFVSAARQRPAWAAARDQATRTRALAAKAGRPVQ
jgi:Flp pilus assembly protein TadD